MGVAYYVPLINVVSLPSGGRNLFISRRCRLICSLYYGSQNCLISQF